VSWAVALPLSALLVLVCTSAVTGAGPRAQRVTKIAIATPEKADDYGWNQQGVQSARAAATYAHASLSVDDGIGYDTIEPVLRRLATSGATFIIAHASGYNTIAPRVAQQFGVPVLTYDDPHDLRRGLVSDIETSSQQGAYLAGVLAARMTKTGVLGIVISAADTNWYKQTGGFVAGARSVNKHLTFRFAQIGQAGYADAAGGKRVAQSVIALGADIVFGMGDGASFGYLQAVETARVGHKVWFIDVIGDKTPLDTHHVLLSSVLWDFRPLFQRAIDDINKGTYGTHYYDLNVSDGIALLRTPFIPRAVWDQIERDRQAILAGTIKVPLTPTEATVRAILK
jgi:simple sugar transport system substrate-binding protein